MSDMTNEQFEEIHDWLDQKLGDRGYVLLTTRETSEDVRLQSLQTRDVKITLSSMMKGDLRNLLVLLREATIETQQRITEIKRQIKESN